MWLITPTGFFSIVQKPGDQAGNTLTLRARVRADLDALRALCLPGLGPVQESKSNDYRYRAVAPRAEVAAAMAQMVNALDYSNFKNQVAKVQGPARAHLYHDVWDVLYRLQSDAPKYDGTPAVIQPASEGIRKVSAKFAAANDPLVHPRADENGKPVTLKKPSTASPLAAWGQADATACVVPDGPMPDQLNGVACTSWSEAPTNAQGWEALAAAQAVAEPAFNTPTGYKKAAGVVLRESDGRVWLVAPSNGFAGYLHTFPKGTVDGKLSTQATALVEAYEESGLRVRLLRHLVDVKRSQSYTRYYLAERVGGNPADMGWESQAVLLVPMAALAQALNSPYDAAVLEALENV